MARNLIPDVYAQASRIAPEVLKRLWSYDNAIRGGAAPQLAAAMAKNEALMVGLLGLIARQSDADSAKIVLSLGREIDKRTEDLASMIVTAANPNRPRLRDWLKASVLGRALGFTPAPVAQTATPPAVFNPYPADPHDNGVPTVVGLTLLVDEGWVFKLDPTVRNTDRQGRVLIVNETGSAAAFGMPGSLFQVLYSTAYAERPLVEVWYQQSVVTGHRLGDVGPNLGGTVDGFMVEALTEGNTIPNGGVATFDYRVTEF